MTSVPDRPETFRRHSRRPPYVTTLSAVAGADVNANLFLGTALTAASMFDHPEVGHALRTDVNAKAFNGETAMSLAERAAIRPPPKQLFSRLRA
jgi:hypothetical protein